MPLQWNSIPTKPSSRPQRNSRSKTKENQRLRPASPRLLKLMKRPASAEDNLARIRAWRAACPDITLRSTFIVGFPGETDAEFEALLDFLEEAELDRVGCFAYSPVEGATANALPDPVPEPVKQERRERFMTRLGT